MDAQAHTCQGHPSSFMRGLPGLVTSCEGSLRLARPKETKCGRNDARYTAPSVCTQSNPPESSHENESCVGQEGVLEASRLHAQDGMPVQQLPPGKESADTFRLEMVRVGRLRVTCCGPCLPPPAAFVVLLSKQPLVTPMPIGTVAPSSPFLRPLTKMYKKKLM